MGKPIMMEDMIPEGYVRTEMQGPYGKIIMYRNPNPDPQEREEGLNDVMDILMIGYLRRLAREGKTKPENGE